MSLETPVNINYTATVVRIKAITELAKCDFVVGTPLFGSQAIVSKDTQVGDLGIYFPAEVQLSEAFVSANNMFRHKEFNADQTQGGYLEDNRRVKAMKFRGHRSDALFLSLDSLATFDGNYHLLQEGDVFDKLGGVEICRKYVAPGSEEKAARAKGMQKQTRVDNKFLPEHIDTDQYWRNSDKVAADATVIITQKSHGTSCRIGHTIVQRKLSLLEKIAKKFGAKVQETEYSYVYGSRKVIKDANNPNQDHYYDHDLWTIAGKKLEGLLPQGFVVYGELIGWTGPGGSPIQAGYTYEVPEGTNELYIYRVAQINPEGRLVDLSWDQVKEFCLSIGQKYVPELAVIKHSEFVPEEWIDIRFFESGLKQALPLGKNKLVDEGVCIRVEGLVPYILKAKSPLFYAFETKQLDNDVVDTESAA